MTSLPATRALGVILILFAAGPALAQEDPIGALLDKTLPPQPAPAAPGTVAPAPSPAPAQPAPQTPAPQEPAPQAYTPQAPIPQTAPPPAPEPAPPPPAEPPPPPVTRPIPAPYTPPPTPRPQTSGRPVQIDETGRTPDGPPTLNDRAYEARMRASFAASQGLQGPLDGRWTVRAGGTELYELQLVDKSSGVLEGAWRDPRRKGAADAAVVDEMSRDGAQVVIRFHPRAGIDAVVVTLTQSGYGAWSGELVEKGERRAVTMKRD